MTPKLQLSGKRFTKLLVLKEVETGKGGSFWECRCDCGNITVIRGTMLTFGKTRSCGCLKREVLLSRITTHGASKTSEFWAWVSMKERCTNPKLRSYKNYGGRGIKVCARWMQSFGNFIADMGWKPSPNHSLDRKDNDGDYTPENCRWSTSFEQGSNMRKSVLITAFGKTLCAEEWGRKTGISAPTIRHRIRSGIPTELALTVKGRSIPRGLFVEESTI